MNTTTSLSLSLSGVGIPAQGSRYARPGLARGGRPRQAVGHETDRGLCSVCGAAWPCARTRREPGTDRAVTS